ncbi:hypothetical protein [Candidatus Nitrosocosmicus arcticus]|uniref:Uncharacterized protein n=1 Tax=Candidatus Nitrosocosmicus arcticus TaxID=2035267 RepID=A0A557SW01_9ARCH|nr:hypothetical protein [Candidatus Nitrosocosmicus arcticus]TVP40784.1 hypothetical protein NARC_60171 [Candidatus Nitrosocosmicus arcticus]
MLDVIVMIGLIVDIIAAFMMYYGKIFRSTETIELMSKHNKHEIKHRILETQLARLGSILLIVGFIIQVIGYAVYKDV